MSVLRMKPKSNVNDILMQNSKCCQHHFIEYNTATLQNIIPFIATKYAIRWILCFCCCCCCFFPFISIFMKPFGFGYCEACVLNNVMRMPSRVRFVYEDWGVSIGFSTEKRACNFRGHTSKFIALNYNQQREKKNTIQFKFLFALFSHSHRSANNIPMGRLSFAFAFFSSLSILYTI